MLNNNNPTITVIVPFYNTEKYLQLCLESIQGQTFTDFEVLLIDTGSTDGSKQICEKFVLMDSRFKLLTTETIGVSSGRNIGLQQAKGEYISFIDSDDWVESTYLESLLAPFKVYSQIDLTLCSYSQFFSPTRIIHKKKPRSRVLSRIELVKAIFGVGNEDRLPIAGGYVWNKMFRKTSLTGLAFENTSIAEDEIFCLTVFKNISFGYFVSQELYNYRMRPSSYVNHPDFPFKHLEMRYNLMRLYEGSEISNILKASFLRAYLTLSLKLLKNKTSIPSSKHYSLLKEYINNAILLSNQPDVRNLLTKEHCCTLNRIKFFNVPYLVFKTYQLIKLPNVLMQIFKLKRNFFQKNKKDEARIKSSTPQLEENLSHLRLMCHANTIANQHSKIFLNYKGLHKNKDIVIVATGETLDKYIPIKDAIHIGVNKACLFDKVKFDYLFLQDYSGSKLYIDRIKNSECVKFYGKFCTEKLSDCNIPIHEIESANSKLYYTTYPDHYFAEDLTTHGLADYHSIVFAALSFALWTHPKRIFLVGCDCSNLYFDGTKGKSFQFLKKGWEKARDFCFNSYPDIEIISINPVGLKGLFKDVYTK